MRVSQTKCQTNITYSLHCSSFLGLPFRILHIELVKPKKGTTMETIGKGQGPKILRFRLSHLASPGKICGVWEMWTGRFLWGLGLGCRGIRILRGFGCFGVLRGSF